MKKTPGRSFISLRLGLVAGVSLASLGVCHAANVISNTGQQIQNTELIDLDQNGWLAQSFITGSTELHINSVTLELGDFYGEGPSPDTPLVVSIYNDAPTGGSPADQPGSVLLTLTAANPTPTNAGSYVYTVPTTTFLSAGTEYWIVASTQSVSINGEGSGSYEWDYTSSGSVDNSSPPSNTDATSGWSLDPNSTFAQSVDSGTTWAVGSGNPQQFEISSSVPEPSTWAMLGVGGAFLVGAGIRNRRQGSSRGAQ